MEGEIIGNECRLTLSRDEMILLVSVMTGVNTAVSDDGYFADLVGWTREELRALTTQIAELAGSMARD